MKKLLLILLTFFISKEINSQWVKQDNPLTSALWYVDFVTSDFGWAAGPQTLLRTTNGGIEWFPLIAKPQSDTVIDGIFFVNKDFGWRWEYEGNNHLSKLYKTTNMGDNWILQYTTSKFSRLIDGQFLDESNGYFILHEIYKSYCLRTTDGGIMWQKYDLDTLMNPILRKIFFFDSNIGWIVGDKLYKTNDGGINWVRIEDPFVSRYMVDIQFITPETGWYSDLVGVYKTTDGGITWANQFSSDGELDASAIFFTDHLNGWFCKYWHLFKTNDGGLTWTIQLSSDTLKLKEMYFLDQNLGWIGSANGLILHTINGGLPVELSSLTASIENNTVLLDWITASELNNKGFEIHRKTTSSDWRKIGYKAGNGTTSQPQYYSYKDDFSDVAVGKILYRLKQIDFNGSFKFSETIEIEIIPKSFSLEQNYPNPFNPSTKISWQSPVDAWQTLKVYDVLGNEVVTLVDEYQPAGTYEVEFSAKPELTSGVYFYQLKVGEYISSRKMILLK